MIALSEYRLEFVVRVRLKANHDPRPCSVMDPSVNMRTDLLVGGGGAIEAKSSRE